MNFGTDIVFLSGLRSAGAKKDGHQFGGIYYPAHTKNGVKVNARWEGTCYLNRKDYTDSTGTRHDGSSETLRIVAWNSNDAKDGKGLADILAKCISVGKEISGSFTLNSFNKRLFVNNTLVTDKDGNTVTYQAINFKLEDDLNLGNDSDATLKAEIGAYNGQVNFNSRPQFWNVAGHADNASWKNIVAARMASVYNGTSGSYGYARVVVPEGVQLLAAAAMPALPTLAASTINTAQQAVQQATAQVEMPI